MKINRSQFRDIIREFLEGDVTPEEDQYPPREENQRVDVYSSGSSKMAKQQLFDLARKAQSMHDQLLDDTELPDWVESKIAVMADNMSTVADHLSYEFHRDEVNSLDEIWGGDIPDLDIGAALSLAPLSGPFEAMPEEDEVDEDEERLDEDDPTGVNSFVNSLDQAAGTKMGSR